MLTFAHKQKPTQHTKSSNSARSGRAFSAQSSEVRSILHLQRTIGNHAVQRLLQKNVEELHVESATPASTRFGQDFSRTPTHPPAARAIQMKLHISLPGDEYEREANRIAEEVLRQRTPDEEGEKLHIRARPSSPAAGGEYEVSEHFEKRLHRSRGGGSPISDQVRAFVEPRMKYDFSKVQIHADNRSARMNKELGAQAFTYGRDIYFGAGQYSPQSIEGKRLLAHELSHVVQQAAGRQNWHIAREVSDAGVGGATLPPLPRIMSFEDAIPLIEEALDFVDPIAGIGDFGRVDVILRRFSVSEVFQLLTTLDQDLRLEGIRDHTQDTRQRYIANVIFYTSRDWAQAPADRMRQGLAALDPGEQNSIVRYIESHTNLAEARETYPVTVLAERQIGHLESVRQQRNRERREAAERSGEAPPAEMTMGEVITEDVEQRSRPLVDVEEEQRREAAELAPRVIDIVESVRASVVGTELESVIQGKTFSYVPERAIREGFYGAQQGNSLLIGVSWVRDADNDPRSVWPNIAHELGGHLEYGRTFSGRIVRGVVRSLPEAARQSLIGDREARRRLFNSFQYAETEVFAELREMRYGRSADDPRRNIPEMLERLRGWFEPVVLQAILRYLWRRVQASSEIRDEDKQFFVQQVAALRVTPRITLR